MPTQTDSETRSPQDDDSSRDDRSDLNVTMLDVLTPENTSSQQRASARNPPRQPKPKDPSIKDLIRNQNESIESLKSMFQQVLATWNTASSAKSNHIRTAEEICTQPSGPGNVASQPPTQPRSESVQPAVGDDSSESSDSADSQTDAHVDSEAQADARARRSFYHSLINEPSQASCPIINQIPPPSFNGDRAEARAWLRKYEEIMEINGYDDAQKLKRARAYLKDEASQWLTTRLHLDPELDWWTLKSAFLTHFCGEDQISLLRRKLDEARQKPNEHPSTYLVRIVDLCKEFKPSMSDAEMVSKIAHGLNVLTFNTLATSRPKEQWTIKWLLTMFERFKFSTEKVSRETSDASKRKTTGIPKVRDLSKWKCFNCGNLGHVVEDCPEPRDEAKAKARLEEHRREKEKRKQEAPKPANERKIQALGTLPATPSAQARTSALACDTVIKPTLTVTLNGFSTTGRIDTGADITALPSHVAQKIGLQVMPWDAPALKAVGSFAQVIGMASVIATYETAKRALLVAILPDSSIDQPLWGMDLLDSFAIQLRFGNPSAIAHVSDRSVNRVYNVVTTSPHPVDKIKVGEIDAESKLSLDGVLIQFSDVFSRDERDIGRTSTIKHRIILTDDTPVHSNYYRIPTRRKPKLQETIDRLLATGAFRESKSPYASPAFFVEKENGADVRLVADYRALNAKTVRDRTPMPHPEDVFGMLSGQRTFAKLDITSMFNQIEVEEEDIPKTAVITEKGLFECPLMPFGLANAPATAVRLMREVLRGLDGEICYVYFDDIIVFAPDFQVLVQRCTLILERLRLHNLKLKPAKCVFAMDSVKFLGHIINHKGIEMDPTRIERVLKLRIPRNPSDVRAFYGHCNYNRKFIRNFADIAKPLTPLMGKPKDFAWSTEAQQAFETLRSSLTRTPILTHFNPEAEHELRTDASSYAVGAVLYQRHSEPDQTGVVSYYSKTMKREQQNYSATEREMLAAFMAIMEYKHYLLGKKFTLVTDHAALSLLRNHKDPHHRLARWVAKLLPFDFVVAYKSGSKHVDADCMSRLVDEDPLDDNVVIKPFRDIVRVLQHVTVESEPSGSPLRPQSPSPLVEEIVEQLPDTRAEQEADEFCGKFIRILESEMAESDKDRLARNFAILNNKLHRLRFKGPPTLVVPARRRNAILLSLHDSPIGGHLGFYKTYATIQDRFYWPKMRRDVKKHVLSCNKCQRRKASNVRRQGYTRPLPIAEEVFDTVGFDLITKLPRSKAGYNTILVCTDNLSKFAITVPLRDESADTIIHAFLNHVIAIHGCPRIVISDRGANLAGEQSRDFFRLYGIIRQMTTPYHPQANGQTERFNRTIAASLTMYIEKEQRDWSDYLQILTFAYNISNHSVTRVSPFEMVFGRRPRLPIDNVLDRQEFIDPSRPAPGALSTEAVSLMKKYILESQAKNKRRLDARLTETTFNEGDLVLVERPTRIKGATNKLTYTYIGPYKIKRKINDLTFEIAFLSNKTINNNVHVRNLRRFIPRDGDVADDCVDPSFIPRESILPPSGDEPETRAEPETEQGPPDELSNAHPSDEFELTADVGASLTPSDNEDEIESLMSPPVLTDNEPEV